MKIHTFINTIRHSDIYIKHIYTLGGCYQFHIVLKSLFPSCVPYISLNKDHVISKYRNRYYDINGIVHSTDDYILLHTKEDIDLVNRWSFHKNNMLRITECPYCDEPIVI
jgi:hypothetical protein